MRYQWPKISELYGDFGHRKSFDSKLYYIRQATRYLLRCFISRNQIKQFVIFVNQDDKLIDFFLRHRGGDYRIVCTSFINQKLKPQKRLELIQDNLNRLSAFTQSVFYHLLEDNEILLFQLGEMGIALKINGTFEEGFLTLELKNHQKRIYGLSFCFDTQKNAFIIPSLQGLNQGEEIRETIKTLTKQCFGLRPQILLVEIARLSIQCFGCEKLLGITQTSQVRFSHFGKKGYFIDYDALWKEIGGIRNGDYFDITQAQHKELSEIPSNKRSMYKKRYALLNEINESVKIKLKEILGKNQCL